MTKTNTPDMIRQEIEDFLVESLVCDTRTTYTWVRVQAEGPADRDLRVTVTAHGGLEGDPYQSTTVVRGLPVVAGWLSAEDRADLAKLTARYEAAFGVPGDD